MSTRYLGQLELLIFGYIRNISNNVPKEINFVCLKYYPKIETVFDISSEEGMKFISENGLTLNVQQENEYYTFASSIGWNKGI